MLKATILPEIYEDELIYSYIARLAVYWGCRTHLEISGLVLEDRLQFPNILFINRYKASFLDTIVFPKKRVDFLIKHTMFPYYARFLPQERRTAAFAALENMDGTALNMYLPVPHRGNRRYLRYCPVCVSDDRKAYGETYWHRSHQLFGIDICPKHGCKLIETDVLIDSKVTPLFQSAEEKTGESREEYTASPAEIAFAKYVNTIFQSEFDGSTPDIRAYLKSRLRCPEYISTRGEEMKITPFHKDFLEWGREYDLHGFTEKWMITKIFSAQRYNPFEICLLGAFTGCTAAEMAKSEQIPEQRHKAFDEAVKALHGQGYDYKEISDALGASYDIVKSVGCGRYCRKKDTD